MARAPVEVVQHAAPGWEDPWSRARACEVLLVQRHYVRLLDRESGLVHEVPLEDVFAARRLAADAG